MNEMKIFKNEEFGEIRTSVKNGKPYFCLADLCEILEIKNSRDCKSRLKEDGVVITDIIDSLGRKQSATFINESNLYKTIFQSRKESAERFTEWVTSEVLPSIRRTGSYTKPMNAIELMELQLLAIKEVRSSLDSVNDDLQNFKKDMPILGIEESRITHAVRGKGIDCLGGKESEAYKDKSLRGKVYSDIYAQLKREFGIDSYKAIKRSQTGVAVDVIGSYELPLVLKGAVEDLNAQASF